MQIDVFTIMIASCVAIFLFGGALLFFWNQDRASHWLAWWVAPFLMGGLGVALIIPRGLIPDLISIGLANALLFGAFGFVWQGARVFGGRPPLLVPVLITALGWMGLTQLPFFMENMSVRVVIYSLVTASFTGLAAWELWRDRAEHLPSRIPAVAVLASFAVTLCFRVLVVEMAPFPVGALPVRSNWVGGFNALVFAHVGFFAMLVISLTKERREAEQRKFALLDPLTGLMNRRAFMGQVERSARRRKYGHEPLTLLVLDLDHFKSVNDRFGHHAGDRVLVAFAAAAEACIRPTDQLYRMGGEEFCFILPDTALPEALAIAERIRRTFAGNLVRVGDQHAATTVSIGVATTAHAGFDLEILLAAADAAVYEAKARGRNRVVVAEPTALRHAAPLSEIGERKRA